MSQKPAKKKTLAEELSEYGERSAYGLMHGAGKIGALAQELVGRLPPSVVENAAHFMESAPGAGAMASVRMGGEAGDLYRQGRYLDAADRFADALEAPLKDVFWLLPGGGIIPKVVK